MKIAYEFTWSDWRASQPFSRLVIMGLLRHRVVALMSLFSVVMCGLLIVGFVVFASSSGRFSRMEIFANAVLLLAVWPVVLGTMAGALFLFMYFFGGFPKSQAVALTSKHFIHSRTNGDLIVSWQNVSNIIDGPRQFSIAFRPGQIFTPQGRSAVYAMSVRSVVIPKRIFADEAAAEAFRKEAERLWMNAKMGVTDGETPEGVWPPAPRRGN